MDLLSRISELCKEKGISRRRMEIEAGLGTGAASKWNKFQPNQASLKKLADFFGVSVAYLQGESEFRTEEDAVVNRIILNQNATPETEGRKFDASCVIPILSEVKAGIPQEAIEEIDWDDVDAWEEIPLTLARTGAFFALRIKGDSMSPRILEGDVVIVKQQPDAESGDIVIAKVNGNNACCKKLIKNKNGITLQSLNPNYAPMYFDKQEMEETPVTIVGKVVELRGKF